VFNSFQNNEEGTCLQKSIQTRKFTALLLVILSLTICVSPFLPQAHAAVTALTVSPKQGKVGDLITVNGTVETANGNYTIFFDSTRLRGGITLGSGKFTTIFNVPRATNGTHTITLQDVTSHTAIENFTVITSYNVTALLPQYPRQLQEGDSVEIQAQIFGGDQGRLYHQNITVITPASTVYNSTVSLLTDQNGTATNTLHYPTDFQPVGANTNYTGTYQVRIYKNTTSIGAQNSFFVGLTNATIYQRLDWVNIKATNYTKPGETANVTIKFGNTKINSAIVSAVNGTIIYNWQVPVNRSKGSYKVTITNATTPGTVKQVADAQNFTIAGVSVKILTTNLNAEPVSGINATVYEIVQNTEVRVASGLTNSSGWTVNALDRGGNYSFKAFWKNVQVNTTKVFIQNNSSWTLTCQLVNMEFTVEDQKTGDPMPLVYLFLNTKYSTVTNASRTENQSFQTNITGKWILRNQLVKANYTILAYRAPLQTQLLFNNNTFTIPQDKKTYNRTIICPTLSLTVHAEDAKYAGLDGYPVQLYEYAGGSYANATTASGNATFSATFGVYKIRLYNKEGTIVLNETYYSLVNASAFFIVRSSIYLANLSVKVLDYFGQPIPNVKVTVEREAVTPITVNTDGNGVAFFSGIIGGDCFVSVYTGGDTPTGTANVFVKESTATTVTLGNYVSVFGLIIDTSQFAVLLTFIVFIVFFVLLMLYRRRKTKVPEEKTTEKES
jgi:hypothetical protein